MAQIKEYFVKYSTVAHSDSSWAYPVYRADIVRVKSPHDWLVSQRALDSTFMLIDISPLTEHSTHTLQRDM